MPHKQNPVIAETSVAFARYNAGQVGVLHQSLLHEQELSGAAWVVEWMTWPTMLATTSGSLDLGCDLLRSITDIGEPA